MRKAYNLTQESVAEIVKISRENLSLYENDKRRPPYEMLNKLALLYNVKLDYLVNGSRSSQSVKTKSPSPSGKPVDIPFCGDIAAGVPFPVAEPAPTAFFQFDPRYLPNACRCMAFRITGDSMAPELLDKDIVIIDPDVNWEDLDHKIVIANIDGECTIKTAHVDTRHKQFILYPINSRKHKALIFNQDDLTSIRIIGALVYLIRRYP